MNNSPLEFLAKKYGNIVKYDKNGNVIGIFVRFKKCKSSDLVEGLPEHTHPAFIINGVEQDSILLGKYKVGETGLDSGPLLSMPNIMPANSMGADQMRSRIRAAGFGISGMTCADYGFVKLLAQKEGWIPKGNTSWGQSHKDATAWKVGDSMQVGTERAYEGYLYRCLIAHTAVAELKPDISFDYWEKIEFIGGVSYDNNKNDIRQTGFRTLNGSGPSEWYLGSNLGNMTDIIGSSLEWQYGYRIYDGELQILENNNAADLNTDLSAGSAAWKAILPNKGNDGYALVTPGTVGTLHWNWTGSAIQLDTQCDTLDDTYRETEFKKLTANPSRLPFVPSIIKELGLYPTSSKDETEGNCFIHFMKGELLSSRGGHYNLTNRSGLGCIYAYYKRDQELAYYGGRSRCL
nr:hypothetical protein [uncultured Blautia sp.]